MNDQHAKICPLTRYLLFCIFGSLLFCLWLVVAKSPVLPPYLVELEFSLFILLFKDFGKTNPYYCLMNRIEELPGIFGEIIAEARTDAGLSQEQVAAAIGASNVFISLLENGKRQPSLTSAILLAWSLGLPPEELVRRVALRLAPPGGLQKP